MSASAMGPATKKRKASVLDDDAKPTENGHRSPSVDGKTEDDDSQDLVDDISETKEMPFTIECPARKDSRRRSKAKDDAFGPEIDDGGYKNIEINYVVRPGEMWANLKPYRNFIVGEQKFSLGSIIYVNRQSPPPPPPPSNASEEEILEWDRQNLWVAKVLEVRAANPQHVYLRVFWLYWPDELPMGRQKYHGANEFVMSNHMEIVDAMTVATAAEVRWWDEKDEDEDLGQRFWRQFYNVMAIYTKTGGLSELRTHCICREFYNPDTTLLKCPHDGCGLWNHEQCLLDAILEKTYKRLVEDSGPAANGTPEATSPATKETPAKKVNTSSKLDDLKSNGKKRQASKQTKLETSNSKIKGKTEKVKGKPWDGMFTAKIVISDTGKGVKVTITDERGQDPETWSEDVQCLKCGKLLE